MLCDHSYMPFYQPNKKSKVKIKEKEKLNQEK